jgi:hypothetical protein
VVTCRISCITTCTKLYVHLILVLAMQGAVCSIRQTLQNRLMTTNWGSFRPAKSGNRSSTSGEGSKVKSSRSSFKQGKKPERKAKGKRGGSPGPGEMMSNLTFLIASYIAWSLAADYISSRSAAQKIDFQTFRTEILARNIVDKVHVQKLHTVWCICLPILLHPYAQFEDIARVHSR